MEGVSFPATTGTANAVLFSLNGDQDIVLEEPFPVRVGGDVAAQSLWEFRRQDRRWWQKDEWRALFFAALSEASLTTTDMVLTLGWPTSWYLDDKDAIRTALTGEHKLKRAGRRRQAAHLLDVRIMPQGLGLGCDMIFDAAGRINTPDLLKQKHLYVNVGSNNTNFIAFPGLKRGRVRLGRSYTGANISVTWERLEHVLVAGKTGSGKSTFLRLLAYQGLSAGMRLLLADRNGTTFPMLADHPALLAPIAHTPAEVVQAVELALGECDHRAALYRQMPGYPEKLSEYNAIAVREGVEPLPRLLVILDEFNATVMEAGGAQGPLATATADLGWRGRQFGANVILAAQDFTKALVGRVRDQLGAVCFRVKNAAAARNAGCEDAVKIPAQRPGLAVTDRWGPMQTYFLDKQVLIAVGEARSSALPEEEQRVALLALEQDGKVTLGSLRDWGLGKNEASRLLEAWRLRGWVKKDPLRNNAHYVTEKLTELIGEKPE